MFIIYCPFAAYNFVLVGGNTHKADFTTIYMIHSTWVPPPVSWFGHDGKTEAGKGPIFFELKASSSVNESKIRQSQIKLALAK